MARHTTQGTILHTEGHVGRGRQGRRLASATFPIKLSDSPTDVVRSPLLGEHTDEVMAELGYTPDQVATLRSLGAI